MTSSSPGSRTPTERVCLKCFLMVFVIVNIIDLVVLSKAIIEGTSAFLLCILASITSVAVSALYIFLLAQGAYMVTLQVLFPWNNICDTVHLRNKINFSEID